MFSITKPSHSEIDRFLAGASGQALSYSQIGIAALPRPKGYQLDTAEVLVGRGSAAFERAAAALRAWEMFDLEWMSLTPSAKGIAPGVNVAVVVRHLGFWSINACRVVYMQEANAAIQFGFAYGTLAQHAEEGEELFEVALDVDTGEVFYRIRAASRPRALLAKLGYPYTRQVQARFRRDSCARMQQTVRDAAPNGSARRD